MGMSTHKLSKNLFIVTLFFIIWGALIYSNTFTASFHYDDFFNIVENTNVHWNSLSFENIRNLFNEEYARPVSFFTIALTYYFSDLDVRGYHYVNIGIHIVTAIGLFLFLRALLRLPNIDENLRSRSNIVAFVSALLWFSSPIQTQAVTYIVQRMTALAAMFYVFALYAYITARLTKGNIRYLMYAIVIILALLAFGSKQNAYTLLFYIFLIEILFINRDIRLSGGKIAVLICIVLIFAALIWKHIPTLAMEPGSWLTYQVKTRFLTSVRVFIFYINQLLFPVQSQLNLEHDFQISRSLFEPPTTVFAVLVVTGLLAYALMVFKKYPLFSFFVIWFFGNLVLESFNLGLVLIFEHRLYLPSMGFFALAGVGLERFYRDIKRTELKWVFAIAMFLTVSLFSVNTYIRNKVWSDEYSLWFDVITKNPNSVNGYINLGNAFSKDDDYDESLRLYLKAKTLDPRNPTLRYGLGVVYFNLKRYDKAIEEFNFLGSMGYIGVGNAPSISYYFERIAKTYYGHKRVAEAIKVIGAALIYDPNELLLKELKEKMEKGTITAKEIMQK